MNEYKVIMTSGKEYIYQSENKLDAFYMNIGHDKPLQVNNVTTINCKFIESVTDLGEKFISKDEIYMTEKMLGDLMEFKTGNRMTNPFAPAAQCLSAIYDRPVNFLD